MRNKWHIALIILVPVAVIGWQIASAELGNIEFHNDLRYIASQTGVNIGPNSPKTDNQVRNDVIASAAQYGIHLQPAQVKLQRITIRYFTRVNIVVDYTTRVNLLLCSFDLHFNQTVVK